MNEIEQALSTMGNTPYVCEICNEASNRSVCLKCKDEFVSLKAALTAANCKIEEMLDVIILHHTWQGLNEEQGAYSESDLCDKTCAALSNLPSSAAGQRRKRRWKDER